MSEFVEWLGDRLQENGWSYNELARRSGLSSGGVSIVMTQRQKPGVEFCRGVARALDEPPEKLFRLAGLLPHRADRDEKIDAILYYYDRMTPQAQEHFERIARALASDAEGSQDVDVSGTNSEAVAPA
jgi:transcriptional regulator with XRE-family HTH domain